VSLTLIAPEYELFPNRRRWSVAECYQMAEEGRLVGRYEVLDGEVVNKMGQKPPHFIGISLLARWANKVFGDERVRIQGPIALPAPDGEFSEPEPDLAVTIEPTIAYDGGHPGPADLLLVAEVSDASLLTDVVVKSRLYARAGIAEYWILDLAARGLHVHRAPVDGEYSSIIFHPETKTVSAAARPDAPVLIADLLPPTRA
jgi:Uma2 family endonuclease